MLVFLSEAFTLSVARCFIITFQLIIYDCLQLEIITFFEIVYIIIKNVQIFTDSFNFKMKGLY